MPQPNDERRIPFSKERLSALPLPTAGRVVYRDARQPGLVLAVSATGSRIFYLYRRVQGRPQRLRIGAFPGCTVDQARDVAKQRIGEIAAGRDPAAERRRERRQPTLGEAWEGYLANAKQRKRTWREDERRYKKFLEPWAAWRLASVTKAEVKTLHSRIGTENGPYEANRVLALLSVVFGVADELGYQGPNPTKGITRFVEQERERFLRADEIPRFFQALNADPSENVRDFLAVLLFVGARRGDVLAMRWADLDLIHAEWTIPRTKTGRALRVHLSEPAIEILQRRRTAARPEAEYVFPGRHGGHLKDPYAAWRRILKAANLTDVRLHDLRRTLASWQAAAGASLLTIGRTLGHRNASTTEIYARLNLDDVRHFVDQAGAAIVQAVRDAEEKRKAAEK